MSATVEGLAEMTSLRLLVPVAPHSLLQGLEIPSLALAAHVQLRLTPSGKLANLTEATLEEEVLHECVRAARVRRCCTSA